MTGVEVELTRWRRHRDELAERIERFGTSMSADERLRAYEEFELAYTKVRRLELEGGSDG